MAGEDLFQVSTPTMIVILVAFYGAMLVITSWIARRRESVDAYMVSTRRVGFGIAAASMTATWIWAASYYGAATAGYTYGLSGPVHYGLWGALMLLFIYPFGQRFRQLAPNAHTLAEIMWARHGAASELALVVSNFLGSGLSLIVNVTAAGALVSVLSPLTFFQGVVVTAVGILAYTVWSGFRASLITDFVQVSALMLVTIVVIPIILFTIGGPAELAANTGNLTAEQANPFSMEAILHQGAPFFAAVLSYAIGNQTISQRIFAVRPDRIKATFVTATFGYGAIVIGLGTLGLIALIVGIKPIGDDPNNILPQMAGTYLPTVLVLAFALLVIASLSSTADSDLAALSSVVMTDVYAKNLARGRIHTGRMLLLGRLTMIVSMALAVWVASLGLDILVLLVIAGGLWGAIVFPVIASVYWAKVTNAAFATSVLIALAGFFVARFNLFPVPDAVLYFMEAFSIIGGGVIIGLMTFAFLGRRAGVGAGIVVAIALAPFFWGFVRDYAELFAVTLAYGVSTVLCAGMSYLSKQNFDFTTIKDRVHAFHIETEAGQETTSP
ncbi:MAG: sodium:proline symporter [Pseudonocardiaceae bacterium]|nr:sodium:proline symporter [Pseudonocardiaceae bacterium]